MSPRSVLFVGNFLSHRCGTRSFCEDLVERLAGQGWKVVHASRFLNRPLRLLDMFSAPLRFRRTYAAAVIDVFSGLSLVWALAASLSVRVCGKPYVIVLRGGALDPEGAAARWLRRAMKYASEVATPSRRLASRFSSGALRVRWIPNGLDLARYPFRRREKPEPRLVWLRALHEIYNPALAIRLLARLPEWPNATLTLYGRLTSRTAGRQVEKLARRLGVGDRVVVAGPVPKHQVPSVLSGHELFLNTTRFESFGLSVLEAAACGLCIATTDVGELPYMWEHETDALLVPADDDRAMAAAVRRILRESGLAAHLSENARRKAEQFDWSIVLPQWERLLLEVAEKGQA